MTAPPVTWRPLGALLVEKGLLTADELEETLAEQQRSGRRLGQILVERGHVSVSALTSALTEQYGIELGTPEGFGAGLRAEIERRHSTRRPPTAETNGDEDVEQVSGDVPLARLEPRLEEHWARLAAAEAELAA